MKNVMKMSMMCLSLSLISQAVFAVEQKAPENKDAQMMQEHMADAMKMGQPSDAHKKFEPFVGKWDYTVKMWMDPKGKPQTMAGKADNTMIMDGRFLQTTAHSEAANNMPAFDGRGVMGYDNVKQEYMSNWIDNMSTGEMKATGSFDSAGKVFSEKGTFSCPMQKKDVDFRAVWTLKDKNMYKYETYMADPKSGKEFKSMEITYKRVATK